MIQILHETEKFQTTFFQLKMPKQRMKMPREMEHLMGQANKEYLVGGHEKAIEICERVIQEHPEFYQPYETLSEIYIDYAKKLGGAKLVVLLDSEVPELNYVGKPLCHF